MALSRKLTAGARTAGGTVQPSPEPFVFVCYSHDDEARVQPLVEWLEAHDLSLWCDRGLRAGALWRHEIAAALERATHVLFFVSRTSLHSDHCDREVQYAIDHRKTLIPVYLESIELTPALRIALERIHALHAERMTLELLAPRILAAVTGESAPAQGSERASLTGSRVPRASTWVAIVLVAMMSGALLLSQFRPGETTPRAENLERSIAVLPFEPMSDDPALQHFAGGLVEDVLDELSALRRLEVASRTGTTALPTSASLSERASALNVSFLLEGSVRKEERGHRVTAQLIRGPDGMHAWSRTFDVAASDSQRELARLIAASVSGFIDLEVMLAQDRLLTASEEAFEHYARAMRLRWEWDAGGWESASTRRWVVASLERAVVLDPEFGPAFFWLHNALAFGPSDAMGLTREQALSRAADAFGRASALMPDSPWVLNIMANQKMNELDLQGAEALYQRIQSSHPDFIDLYGGFGNISMRRGRLQEAIGYLRLQLETDPSVWMAHFDYAIVLLLDRQFDVADRALEFARRLAGKGPGRVTPTVWRIAVPLYGGDYEEANSRLDAAWRELGQSNPDDFVFFLGRLGRHDELRHIMAKWDAAPDRTPPMLRFWAHYGLKEYDEAVHWLRQAVEQRDWWVLRQIRIERAYAEVRDHPEFAKVLEYVDEIQVSR
jgi:TolB-like protein